MRIAALALHAAFDGVAVAARELQLLVNGGNDFGDRNHALVACKPIAAAGTARAFHQLRLAQFAEQLLQIFL